MDLSASWKARRKRWLRFVHANIRAMKSGGSIPLGPMDRPLVAPEVTAGEGPPLKVVFCAPHPDDEVLVGALPWRLRQECGAQVVDCAITLGSNVGQRERRLKELKAACLTLGFGLRVVNPPLGFDHIIPDNRSNHPEEWAAKVRKLSEALEAEKPDAVFAPHAEDFNSTHIGTHHLTVDALTDYLRRTGGGPLPFFETEFWHQNSCPNLLVGIAPEDEAVLLMAAAEHGDEVRRNPYHLRHPGRLIDIVRLGAETVGGQGGAAPDFPFGELYRLVFVGSEGVVAPRPGGRILAPEKKIAWNELITSFRPETGN